MEVGTANFVNPKVCPEIISGLSDYLDRHKMDSITELIGKI